MIARFTKRAAERLQFAGESAARFDPPIGNRANEPSPAKRNG